MRFRRRRVERQVAEREQAAAESMAQAEADLAAAERRAAEAHRVASKLRELNTANHFDELLISHWRGRRA
jgi:hypothetical protein